VRYQPAHRGEEAHPLPEYRCCTTHITCFVKDEKDKKQDVTGYDGETPSREGSGEFLDRCLLFSYYGLKKDNAKKIKADAALVDSRPNAERHCGHEDCADCGYGADCQNCDFKGFFIIPKAAEPKHKQDNDGIAKWSGQDGAGIEQDLGPSRSIPDITQVSGEDGKVRVGRKVGQDRC